MNQPLNLPSFEDCLPDSADYSMHEMANELDRARNAIIGLSIGMDAQHTTQLAQIIQDWCGLTKQNLSKQLAASKPLAASKQLAAKSQAAG